MKIYELTLVLIDYLHGILGNYSRLRAHLIKREGFYNIKDVFKSFYVNLINILDGKLDVLKPTLDNYIETNQDWYLNYVAVYDNEAVLVLMKDKLLKVY